MSDPECSFFFLSIDKNINTFCIPTIKTIVNQNESPPHQYTSNHRNAKPRYQESPEIQPHPVQKRLHCWPSCNGRGSYILVSFATGLADNWSLSMCLAIVL